MELRNPGINTVMTVKFNEILLVCIIWENMIERNLILGVEDNSWIAKK